jgi:hypothetical protein
VLCQILPVAIEFERVVSLAPTNEFLLSFLEDVADALDITSDFLQGLCSWPWLFELFLHQDSRIRYEAFVVVTKVFRVPRPMRASGAQCLRIDSDGVTKSRASRANRLTRIRAAKRRLSKRKYDGEVIAPEARIASEIDRSRHVSICGILLAKRTRTDEQHRNAPLVTTPCTYRNLRKIASALTQAQPLVVEVPRIANVVCIH